MKPLQSADIRGNWATVLLPINADESIDFARLADEIESIASFGVNGLYTNGTAGEFHTQTEAEFDHVQQLAADICTRREVPFQIGVSHMSAQISLERAQRVRDLAPSAVQVILPDWVFPQMAEAEAFLQRMAEALDPVGMVLYNPPHAKGQLTPAQFGELKQRVPALLGVKVAGGDADWYSQMREEMLGLSVFVPGHHLATGIASGAHGAYSNVACIHPLGAQRWYDMMLSDMDRAQVIEQQLRGFMDKHMAPLSAAGYSNSALDKLLCSAGGWTDVGPRLRWPYRYFDDVLVRTIRANLEREAPAFMELCA